MRTLFLSVLLTQATAVVAAPAPKYRPQPPFNPIGEWKLTWIGNTGPIIFRPDGTLTYFWGHTLPQKRWTGLWELKTGTLRIWSWADGYVPEKGMTRDEKLVWPLTVEGSSSKAVWGKAPGGNPWKMERLR